MGVQGWHRLLIEQGWLPFVDYTQAATSNRSSNNSNAVYPSTTELLEDKHNQNIPPDRFQTLPPDAVLHLDGACVCFQIHTLAYARYMEQVLQPQPQNGSSSNIKHLSPTQMRHLLPSFLPLELLDQVTEEFLQPLLEQNRTMKVYWDGDQRYAPPTSAKQVPAASSSSLFFKHDTEVERQSKRMEEWSTLEQYCSHGRVPKEKDVTLAQWERTFPKNRLFIAQIMVAMTKTNTYKNLEFVFCNEEADAEMAKMASGDPTAFLIGLDSDFCFFPNVNYIPITSLSLDDTDTVVKAIVLRRDILAEALQLPEEGLMVELALLMGNDYVSNETIVSHLDADLLPSNLRNKFQHRNLQTRTTAILEWLRGQPTGYHLRTSNNSQVQDSLEFSRKLYNLQDMSSEYRLEDALGAEETSVIPAVDESILDLKTIAMDPQQGDKTVYDAVLRYLQLLVEHLQEQPIEVEQGQIMPFLTPAHIDAFRHVAASLTVETTRPTYALVDKDIADAAWRPHWEDVPAVYWMERITSNVIQNTIQQQQQQQQYTDPAALEAPSALFDPYLYHAMLRVAREQEAGAVPETLATEDSVAEEPKERLKLPVDEFESTILESVQKHRVTIIQGETGCGKSSRIPVMLLNAKPPDPTQTQTKLFISQPRRIAAKALIERLRATEPQLKDQIALRMGHGVREYETNQTRAWFVTTGYLVRLMANHPERFDDVSVLIIDEVHERSVDTDILCLLCRRLLSANKRIRLVLMSATLAAALYQDYFGTPEPPIKVGARRFPVEEVFLDDIRKKKGLSVKERKQADKLLEECLEMKAKRPPSMAYMEKLYSVVASLATVVGKPGTSVLIFVPGMNDIVAITEIVESINVAGVTFTCFPIHSDIPFEDQMHVFDAAKPDEVKIVIATNAAESSVTLPDVDNVICLGLCKQIVYNEASHRQMLLPTWISRASATQRAGRTGRVRPGTVYRMYARQTYENEMDAFEPGELLRIPLDSVILMLKEMLTDEEATDVLLNCLEPPDVATIGRSFESLFRSHFITTPDDSCEITTLGAFVSALGIDLALGSLIGLGIQMGVGAEAIEIAAILSFPKTPWVMSNPLIHPTKEFNEQTKKTYVSRCHFDANLYSEPLSIMNLVWDYDRVNRNESQKWCLFYGVFLPRIKRLSATIQNLRKRVADFLGIHDDLLKVEKPPSQMPHGMVTILRVIQVWVFHETLIQYDPARVQNSSDKKGVTLSLTNKSDQIENSHLRQVLMEDRHPFTLKGSSQVQQRGTFEYLQEKNAKSPNTSWPLALHGDVISYSTEKEFDCAWISNTDTFVVFARKGSAAESEILNVLQRDGKQFEKEVKKNAKPFITSALVAKQEGGKTRRGKAERASGAWTVAEATNGNEGALSIPWTRYEINMDQKAAKAGKHVESLKKSLEDFARSSGFKCFSLHFPWKAAGISPGQSLKFELISFGSVDPVANIDLRDMLGPGVQDAKPKKSFGKQMIHFPVDANAAHLYKGKLADGETATEHGKSWERPLIKCIPEGARLLSVMASSRRREQAVKMLPSSKDKGSNKSDKSQAKDRNKNDDKTQEAGEDDLEMHLEKSTNIAFRWKRFNTDDLVYVDTNSVPASAVPLLSPEMMYSVCANTLELRGGSLRAEGLTLLPQGKQFLLLSRFSFGLFQQSNFEDGTIYKKAIAWIDQKADPMTKKLIKDRVEKAVRFHHSASQLGETLECFPEKVSDLLEIFHLVDGYRSEVWDSLKSNPFIRRNLVKHKSDLEKRKTVRFYRRESSGVDGKFDDDTSADDSADDFRQAELIAAATSHLDSETKDDNQKKKAKKNKKKAKKKNKAKDGTATSGEKENKEKKDKDTKDKNKEDKKGKGGKSKDKNKEDKNDKPKSKNKKK